MLPADPAPEPDSSRVFDLLEQARRLPPEQRLPYVQKAAGDDKRLAARVLSLLDLDATQRGETHDIDPPPGIRRPAATAMRPLGDFDILRPLEEGGMGVVWLARQRSLDRIVALKTFHARGTTSETARNQFLRAAQLAARLQHPHVVSTYTAGLDADTVYYVMEHIEGVTLERVIEALRNLWHNADDSGLARLPAELLRAAGLDAAVPTTGKVAMGSGLRSRTHVLRRALGFMVEAFVPVVEAIEHAHRQGIVHGDIKPANLIFDRTGRLLVLDFGLAHTISLVDSEAPVALAGTARYMSPEQVAGLPKGHAPSVDIYALGVTLYEILALQPAYDGPSREAILARIATESPTPLRQVNPRVHWDLDQVVERAMHRQPRRRYPTAANMAQELRRFLRRQPLSSVGSGLLATGRRALHDHPKTTLLAAVTLMVVIALGLQHSWALWRGLEAAARADALQAALEATIDDARRSARDDGDGRRLQAMEGSLERAADLLVGGHGQGVAAAVLDELRRRFAHDAVAIRVAAYSGSDANETAYQFFAEATRSGVDVSQLIDDLARARALGTLDVACPPARSVVATLLRVDEFSNSTDAFVCASGALPARFEHLFPGEYVVELGQDGAAPIRLPAIVRGGQRCSIRLPYAPSDVPAGMVYVPCHESEEFVCGDHQTVFAVGCYGPVTKRLYRSFFLDRHEVTNAQYATFYQAPDCADYLRAAVATFYPDKADELPADVLTIRAPANWTMGRPATGTEAQPVVLNDWFAAMAYAAWRGAELPTGDEWERAARGIGARVFPYGDVFTLSHHYSARLGDVGSHPGDESVYGVRDLLGSVAELTLGPVGGAGFELRGAWHHWQDPFACRASRDTTLGPHAGILYRDLADEIGLRVLPCMPSLHGALRHILGPPFGLRCALQAKSPEIAWEAL